MPARPCLQRLQDQPPLAGPICPPGPRLTNASRCAGSVRRVTKAADTASVSGGFPRVVMRLDLR